jgi:Tfp pilus assembly protein PilE
MAVVVISSILALVGVTLFRAHVDASRGTEAYGIIQALRAAEESYTAENHGYLNVSTAAGGLAWYPMLVPTTTHASWVASTHADYTRWQQLAPAINRSVMFGYLLNAGPPGTVMPQPQVANGPDLSAPQPLDWYLIQASGDVNGNGVFARYASTSITGTIYVENEGE